MDHHLVSYIDSNMSNALYIRPHRSVKENQITRPEVFRLYFIAERVQAGSASATGVVNAGAYEHPANKAGAVKALRTQTDSRYTCSLQA